MVMVKMTLLTNFFIATTLAYVPVDRLPACTRSPTCGRRGSLQPAKTDQLAVFNPVPNLDSCRIEALQTDQSLSLSYDSNQRTCRIYRKLPAKMGFKKNASSTTAFYRKNCFDCLNTCPTPQGVNLLVNPGFEAATSSYKPVSPWNDNVLGIDSMITPSASAPGRKSAHAASRKSLLRLTQSFHYCPGQLYSVSFDYKFQFTNASETHYLGVGVSGLSDQRSFAPAVSNNAWQTYRNTTSGSSFDSPANLTTLGLFLSPKVPPNDDSNYTSTVFFIDNVVVTPAALR